MSSNKVAVVALDLSRARQCSTASDISHVTSPKHLRSFNLELAQPPYESADDDCAAAGEQQQV
jgi:hypothetical protein